jgi:p21-activated kinase 1
MIECYEWKDECWVVMEFLEGGTLTEARKSHNFEEKEIAYIAKELLKGLVYLHSLGIVHRDLKSENIMMSVLGDIKLIDFGLAIDANKIRPTMVGSPYWLNFSIIFEII